MIFGFGWFGLDYPLLLANEHVDCFVMMATVASYLNRTNPFLAA